MKNFTLLFLFLFFNQVITCQVTESEKIFWDLIDYKIYPGNYSDIGYLSKVNLKMFTRKIDYVKKDSTLVYYNNRITKNDSIVLSIREKEYLISELDASKNYSWSLKNSRKLILVQQKNMLKFLKEDRKRELKIISKPIFIRNKQIAILYNVHLCCGHIYGYSSISFYKKNKEKWKEWIPIVESAF